MFEKAMKEKLERIFDLGKVTYERPSESREQQALFVDVRTSHARMIDKRQIAMVDGVLTVFANSEKMPFGYLSKRISNASADDKRGFFFGPEQNIGVFRNIAERKLDFTFLFDSQYDPNLGSLTDIEFAFEEN